MQEHQYTYSFIIPHHNSPELLNRCLDSIPQREDIQIIVVDDNSAEDKRPCIKRDDVEVIYIDAEHTKGAGRARNYGLKAAKGKWLLFADCDDYYYDGFLEVLDQYKDKDIEVLYFNYYFIDGIDKTIIQDNNLQKTILSYDGSKEKTDYIKFRNNTPWTKMARRDFVKKYKMYFEEVVNGNDILFSLFIGTKTTHFKICPSRLYFYIRNKESIGTKCQTYQDIMCRIIHIFKYNYLYKILGHNEYRENVLLELARLLRYSNNKTRYNVLIDLMKNLFYIFNKRKEWYYVLNE